MEWLQPMPSRLTDYRTNLYLANSSCVIYSSTSFLSLRGSLNSCSALASSCGVRSNKPIRSLILSSMTISSSHTLSSPSFFTLFLTLLCHSDSSKARAACCSDTSWNGLEEAKTRAAVRRPMSSASCLLCKNLHMRMGKFQKPRMCAIGIMVTGPISCGAEDES